MANYLETSKQYKGFHYSVLSNDMLRYLHETGLKMLKEIVRVFEKHNIRYSICGGTLLGACTTGRFIPWDDDVDMCVIEEDYEKMRIALINELPSWMLVQCIQTEPKYFHGWIKVRDRNSKCYPEKDGYDVSGVWVDIYKLIPIKEKRIPFVITKEHKDYLIRRHKVGGITQGEMKKRIKENSLNQKLLCYRFKSVFSRKNNDYYLIFSASKISIKKEWVFPLCEIDFEGIRLKTFNSPSQYLVNHYGADYSKVPQEELRRVGIDRVVFGMFGDKND